MPLFRLRSRDVQSQIWVTRWNVWKPLL